ncbi:ribulokinase [Verrucomicrobia bacterium LW23]|nr:ribulokinase [Verrucomicrobia bacterium LW23]
MKFTIGVDYGTNSVRAILVRTSDGREIGTAVVQYPSGREGVLLDPADHNLARQHPGDYLVGLEESIRGAIAQASAFQGFAPDRIVGIGVDTTGSSPLPVDAACTPLALLPRWKGHLAAQCWLWKDHTSHEEAAAITAAAVRLRPQYIAKCGNTYSSEWFWSKIWHCLNTAPEVFDAAHSWVELSDYIPAVLAGVTRPEDVRRGVCAAGHKAMYSAEWQGLPDAEFLAALHPKLAELRPRLYDVAYDASHTAGTLCEAWAEKLGVPAGIPIAIGEMDVHYGAIACGVTEGTLVKVMGTSTCDCAVVPVGSAVADIPGICGIVNGSILPGHYGIEAGQSAVGDIFKWWAEVVCQGDSRLHAQLTAEAAAQRPGEHGLLALDWNNGNRTILVNPRLTGLLLGQTLYTSRADVYRALVEATAFGARAIIERIREYGVRIDRVVCAGGIAEKNAVLMQIYADITGCTMQVAGSSQACALGSAISAAVVAGEHADFASAQASMASIKDIVYAPKPENARTYDKLYAIYRELHDAFGGVNKAADLSSVMRRLIEIKTAATTPAAQAEPRSPSRPPAEADLAPA